MRRGLITLLVLAGLALMGPAALAATPRTAPAAPTTTQTASAGAVTATFTFSGQYPEYKNLHLPIAKSGSGLYAQPGSAKACGAICAPQATSGGATSVSVVDLDDIGQPNV